MNFSQFALCLIATFTLCVGLAWAERTIILPDHSLFPVYEGETDEAARAKAREFFPKSFSCNHGIDINGEIKAGLLRRVQSDYESCKKEPQFFYNRALIVNSLGGSVEEAIAIGRFVRKNKLSVRVFEKCFSSCVFILAAGSSKTIAVTAKIGIHRPFLENKPNGPIGDVMRRVLAEARIYFAEMNIPEQLADEMFSIPPERLKILSESQLSFYRLDQMDMAEAEEVALFQAKKLGISRQELMRRDKLFEDALRRECSRLYKENDRSLFLDCAFKLRGKYGL